MEPVDVLGQLDGAQHLLLVHVLGQRQLHRAAGSLRTSTRLRLDQTYGVRNTLIRAAEEEEKEEEEGEEEEEMRRRRRRRG